jgi:hypothetical protein
MVAEFNVLPNIIATGRKVRIIGFPGFLPCAGLRHVMLSNVVDPGAFSFYSELDALRFSNISIELRAPGVGAVEYSANSTTSDFFKPLCSGDASHDGDYYGHTHFCKIDGSCEDPREQCFANPLCAICSGPPDAHKKDVLGDNNRANSLSPADPPRLPMLPEISSTKREPPQAAAKYVDGELCPVASKPKLCTKNVFARDGAQCRCFYTGRGGSFHQTVSGREPEGVRDEDLVLADRLMVTQVAGANVIPVIFVDQSRYNVVIRGSIFSGTGFVLLGPVRRAAVHDNLIVGTVDFPSLIFATTVRAKVFSNTIVYGEVWAVMVTTPGAIDANCNALLSLDTNVFQPPFSAPTAISNVRNTFLVAQTTPGIESITLPVGTTLAQVAQVKNRAPAWGMGAPAIIFHSLFNLDLLTRFY